MRRWSQPICADVFWERARRMLAENCEEDDVRMSTHQIEASIRETDPLVWRRIVVPDRITFHQLHLILQECFSWKNYHLYQFHIPGVEGPIRRFCDDAFVDEGVARDGRDEFVDAYLSEGLRFTYIYDLGDYWGHVIEGRSRH